MYEYFEQELIHCNVLYFGWPNQPSPGTMRVYIGLILYIYVIRNKLLEANMFVMGLILQTFRRLELRQRMRIMNTRLVYKKSNQMHRNIHDIRTRKTIEALEIRKHENVMNGCIGRTLNIN